MSITISTCNEICNSPLNQSKAKMLYTFSKEDRFKRLKKQLYRTFYLGVIDFMIFQVLKVRGLLVLVMELNQILQKRNKLII